MKKAIILTLLLMLPLASANTTDNTSINFLDLGGFADTAGEGIGIQNASNMLLGGGGNPLSIMDPLSNFFNELLNTQWGFLIALTIIGLIMAIIKESLVGGLLISYAVYILAQIFNLHPISLWVIASGAISAIIIYFLTKKNKKVKKWRSIFITILVVFIVAVVVLTVLNLVGYRIPGWS